MSTGDMVVLAIVLLLVIGAICSLIRAHLLGKCSCGCENCSGCCGKVLDIKDKEN